MLTVVDYSVAVVNLTFCSHASDSIRSSHSKIPVFSLRIIKPAATSTFLLTQWHVYVTRKTVIHRSRIVYLFKSERLSCVTRQYFLMQRNWLKKSTCFKERNHSRFRQFSGRFWRKGISCMQIYIINVEQYHQCRATDVVLTNTTIFENEKILSENHFLKWNEGEKNALGVI